MKIKLKLISFILLVLIIPVIIINLMATGVINEKCMDVNVESIERSMKNQAEDINFVCEDLISDTKELTNVNVVRDYVSKTTESDFEFDSEDEEYQDVLFELTKITSYSDAVIKAMIINETGIVIASTSISERGRRMSEYKELFAAALENNGFSGVFMSSENHSESPVYTVSKSIYSKDNERKGILYVIYDSTEIQKYINNIKLDKYTSAAIMDRDGNILEYPYKNMRSYSENANYSQYADVLKNLTAQADTDEAQLNVIYDTGNGVNERLYYSTPITNSGWYLLSVTDKHGLEFSISRYYSGIQIVSIVIVIVLAVLVCIFADMFARPVRDIIKVFSEKQKGSGNVRFDIRTNDEFRQIGTAFNSMFDNIFESEQRYRTIVEMTNNIIFEINYKKGTVYVSKNFNKKFSFRPKDDTLQESFLYKLRIHKDDKERYFSDLERILGPAANFLQGEYRIKSIYGDFIWIMIKATKFFDRDEVPTKIVGVIVDIDREKKSEMHLLQRANYDNLTQLYNRETFLKTLSNEIELSAVKKTLDSVMFIDLDDFKFFNDEYGHACGDEVLKFVADTLKEISFERGFAGRFGGDEFVVCFTGLTLYGDSGKIAQEIIDALGKGFVSESTGLKLLIKCSIGIAFLRESGKNTEEIIAAADEAMYNIKKHGKSAYAYAKSVSKSDGAPPQILAPSTSAIDSDMSSSAGYPYDDNIFD